MAEKIELKVASKESVALQLTMEIATKEALYEDPTAYRKKLLDLYSECLKATMAIRSI